MRDRNGLDRGWQSFVVVWCQARKLVLAPCIGARTMPLCHYPQAHNLTCKLRALSVNEQLPRITSTAAPAG